MADAFIYDAVRTPRGRGKPDGALHEVTALNLAGVALALVGRDRRRARCCRDALGDVVSGRSEPRR